MTQIPAPLRICQWDDGLAAYHWDVTIPICEAPNKWAQRDMPAQITPDLFAVAFAQAGASSQSVAQIIASATATTGGFTFTGSGWTGGGGHCCTAHVPDAPPPLPLPLPPSPVPLPAGGLLLALALAALVACLKAHPTKKPPTPLQRRGQVAVEGTGGSSPQVGSRLPANRP